MVQFCKVKVAKLLVELLNLLCTFSSKLEATKLFLKLIVVVIVRCKLIVKVLICAIPILKVKMMTNFVTSSKLQR